MKPIVRWLQEIRSLAESCAKQLTAWIASIESSSVHGKRHLTGEMKERREVAARARDFRVGFLRNLKPNHPLFNSPEARAARGEAVEE